jgi:cyclic pyranopterin phosphate synthase
MIESNKNKTLSHIDQHNNPTMVDVSNKSITSRIAIAQSKINLPAEVKSVLYQHEQGHEISSKKGPVFQTAIIAGVMAAKKTHELIPFCHPLGLEHCKIKINVDKNQNLIIVCECKVSGKTGVEMEALMGASIAALTVYDMCKALSHEIIIGETRLLSKSGGKSIYNTNTNSG